MSYSSRSGQTLVLAAALALASCKGAEQVCDPTDPLCGGTPTIANIAITSPVDTVIAVGRTVTMTAAATSSTGGPITATFTWSSTNVGVATVTPSGGAVTANAAGTTTIQALSGGVTGTKAIRAVNADLALIASLLGDQFRQLLTTELGATPESTLTGFLTTCGAQLTAGHVRNIDTCLQNALGVSSANGNDQALLGVLSLYFSYAQDQLQL
jgi:hypothetical protein